MRFTYPSRTRRPAQPKPAGRVPGAPNSKRLDWPRTVCLAGLCIALFDGAHLVCRAEAVRDWVTGRALLAGPSPAAPEAARRLVLASREIVSRGRNLS